MADAISTTHTPTVTLRTTGLFTPAVLSEADETFQHVLAPHRGPPAG
ncbi:hypothetical protein ACOQFL_16260 [Actinopolyspora sp. H202]